ncbi:MAG: hypothetical protein RR248_02385 [Clostridia bacterium]
MKNYFYTKDQSAVIEYEDTAYNSLVEIVLSFSQQFAELGLKIDCQRSYYDFSDGTTTQERPEEQAYYDFSFVYNIIPLDSDIAEATKVGKLIDNFTSLSSKRKGKFSMFTPDFIQEIKQNVATTLQVALTKITELGYDQYLADFKANDEVEVARFTAKFKRLKTLLIALFLAGIVGLVAIIIFATKYFG